MAVQTPRRRAWTGIGLAVGLLAITLGAWGLRTWAPFQHPAPGADVFWPRNVAPLALFVEEHTGLQFVHPVTVEFVADRDAFASRTGSAPQVTERRRTVAETDAAVGRALGYWSGDVSLIEGTTAMSAAADFGSEWLPDERTVVVRADGPDSTLSPLDRAELVVLLTEIIDDQHFDIAHRLADAPTPQRYQALLGLDLGQALWVRDRYIDGFDDDDAGDYFDARAARAAGYEDAVTDVPVTYRAIRVVAQNLGPAFVAALHEGGFGAVDRAFGDDTPTALDQLSLPDSKYTRRDRLEPVEPPPTPLTGEFVYDRQLGPFGVYLILAAATASPDALVAADGWGNDSFTAYRLDGRVCVDGRIVADSRADADRMSAALEAWAATRPPQATALVGRDDTALLLSVCDPGPDVDQPTPSQHVLDQFFGRADLLAGRIQLTGKPDLAECVAVTFYQRYSIGEIDADPSFDVVGELESISAECTDSV